MSVWGVFVMDEESVYARLYCLCKTRAKAEDVYTELVLSNEDYETYYYIEEVAVR
jgi:hypothetical protein